MTAVNYHHLAHLPAVNSNMLNLLPLLLAATTAAVDRVVDRHTLRFTSYPLRTPTVNNPDGPLAANGDLGVSVGHSHTDNGGLGLYLGKNDFWGWPGPVIYHASFEHYTPGAVRLTVPAWGNLTRFEGTQCMRNGTVTASVHEKPSTGGERAGGSAGGKLRGATRGYWQNDSAAFSGRSLSISATVLVDINVVLVNISATCGAAATTDAAAAERNTHNTHNTRTYDGHEQQQHVAVNISLSTPGVWELPTTTAAVRDAGGRPSLQLTKESLPSRERKKRIAPCVSVMTVRRQCEASVWSIIFANLYNLVCDLS
jgi:hypothetical protein